MVSKIDKVTSVLVLSLILAACGGAAPPAASSGSGDGVGGPIGGLPTQPGQVASAIDSCALLSDEEIEAATQEGVSERRVSTLTQVFPSVCDIVLDGGGSLTVGVRSPGGRNMYETSFEPFIGVTEALDETVTGLGDKAARSGESEIMVLAGDVLFDIHFIGARPDKLPAVTYLAERILARLPCLATGCPAMTVPPAPTIGPPTPSPTQLTVDPGSLPSTGARARVVNLFTENDQPVDLEVYAWTYSDAEMREVPALVATVPYGQASDWFNPGLAQTPFSEEPYTKVTIERSGGPRDPFTPLAGVGEFLGPGTVTTISVWTEELFEDEFNAWVQTIYAEHPEYEVPDAPEGKGLLVTRLHGLLAEEESPFLYASIGDGCLESPLGRSDPEIPNTQPIANDLALPLGQHTLTVHEAAALGELPTCADKALGPGVPITVAEGDRLILFPYRLPGTTEISQLVLPFD